MDELLMVAQIENGLNPEVKPDLYEKLLSNG